MAFQSMSSLFQSRFPVHRTEWSVWVHLFGRDYQNTVVLFQYLSEVGMLTVPSRQSREMTNLG